MSKISREEFDKLKSGFYKTKIAEINNAMVGLSYNDFVKYQNFYQDMRSYWNEGKDVILRLKNQILLNPIGTGRSIYFFPGCTCKRDNFRSKGFKLTRLKNKTDILIIDTRKLKTVNYNMPKAFEFEDIDRATDLSLFFYSLTPQIKMSEQSYDRFYTLVTSKDKAIATASLEHLCNFSIELSPIFLGHLFFMYKMTHWIPRNDRPSIFYKLLKERLDSRGLRYLVETTPYVFSRMKHYPAQTSPDLEPDKEYYYLKNKFAEKKPQPLLDPIKTETSTINWEL